MQHEGLVDGLYFVCLRPGMIRNIKTVRIYSMSMPRNVLHGSQLFAELVYPRSGRCCARQVVKYQHLSLNA